MHISSGVSGHDVAGLSSQHLRSCRWRIKSLRSIWVIGKSFLKGSGKYSKGLLQVDFPHEENSARVPPTGKGMF